jgi:transcriptional regulator with PAS, ATPase and Fis domain
VEGQTGTGKEGVARAIHDWSGRAGNFIAVNCSAIPENLAEAEFFGYRRGAFTGADKAHDGYFRAAHKGTLFLDEVADLPASLQPKLLRALEQGEVMPIGESQPSTIDVRLIAAVQGPLAKAVQKEKFRADLYARLDGVSVRLPPLCERIDELPFLVDRLLDRHLEGQPKPKLETSLVEAMCRYRWPYNIRELDRVIQQMVALHANQETLSRADLPEKLRSEAADSAESEAYRPSKDALLTALKKERGNVNRAAQRLGLNRQRMYRLLEAIPGFDLDGFRKSVDKDPI